MVVGIDEAWFFDDDLVQVANELADTGRRVVIARLLQRPRERALLCSPKVTHPAPCC